MKQCFILYINHSNQEKYTWGEEDHLNILKAEGNDGDFIIYQKHADQNFPIRIAAMQNRTIVKVRIQSRVDGSTITYCWSKTKANWYNTVSDVIDNGMEEYNLSLDRPFLGLTGPDLLGEERPCDINIFYHMFNAKLLLFSKPHGYYLVHQGSKNNHSSPYTIYVSKKNNNTGEVHPCGVDVQYDSSNKTFFLNPENTYSSLHSLLDASNTFFINQIFLSVK